MSLALRSFIALTILVAVLLGLGAGSLYFSEESTTPETATIAYAEHFPESEEMLNRMAAELQLLSAENLSSIETAAGSPDKP